MYLSSIDILQVRNLTSLQLECHPAINVIYGANGSGKTSILEAIYLLGRGRSFKHRDLRLVVNHESDELVVSAKVERQKPKGSHRLGIRRTTKGLFEARLDGRALQSAAQLVEELPLQLIDAHSFNLLEGGALQRRQFLDWGVFHVEHSYTDLWRRFQKALKQRNQLLRHGRIDEDSLRAWTTELIPLSEEITRHRRAYLEGLVEHVEAVSKELDGLGDLSFDYYQGWADEAPLADVMVADQARDLAVGTTSHGAHKADMKIRVDGVLASECLSRGQIKLLVYALKLAQATFYRDKTGESCLFLLDDLPAELDYLHRQQIVGFLRGLDCQVFMTGVDKRDFQVLVEGMAHHMFHVEHGVATKSEITGN